MEILENKKEDDKKFSTSDLLLSNRKALKITGIEKVFETNESHIQLKVAGSFLLISGQNLNISQLDVENGTITIEGIINELNYSENKEKRNFLKKIFK